MDLEAEMIEREIKEREFRIMYVADQIIGDLRPGGIILLPAEPVLELVA